MSGLWGKGGVSDQQSLNILNIKDQRDCISTPLIFFSFNISWTDIPVR